MKIETLTTDQAFLSHYLNGAYQSIYDYQVTDNDFKQRVMENKHSHGEALGQVIDQYMDDFVLTDIQKENINHIKRNAWVVIGGQQAGLFVSPLYTIHKIISIIILAREQSEKLKTQIVPVFWIAGEDHDFDEVNHAYLYEQSEIQLKKVKVATKRIFESAVSDITLTQQEKDDTVHQFIKHLQETPRTKKIYEHLLALPNAWTPMFKQLIHLLFKEYGLLLIDSHDAGLRKIEQQSFHWMLENHEAINRAFLSGQDKAVGLLGGKTIESSSNVHLFINNNEGRQLLSFNEGIYQTAKSDETYSKNDLQQLIETHPEQFSNNVVTRPVMQEMMFNTLAFIAGPSEIKYWAELKEVFELLGRKMPVIVPRMQLTYVKQAHIKMIEELNLSLKDIITHGIADEQVEFLQRNENKVLLDQLEDTIRETRTSYEHMSNAAENDQVAKLIHSNLKQLEKQFDYLKKHYRKEIRQRNDINLKKFKQLELTLHPNGGMQERVWHPLQILNETSLDLFDEILKQLQYTFEHIIVHTD